MSNFYLSFDHKEVNKDYTMNIMFNIYLSYLVR